MSGPDVKTPPGDAGPGAVLAAAREEIGVSQREVAEALNLPINVVDAIEVGDNSRLPSHVFTRGYVRAYAKLLELDADPLVAALVLEHEEQEVPPSVPHKRVDLAALRAINPQILFGAGVAVIVLLILIGVFASGSDESEVPVQQPAGEASMSSSAGPASGAAAELAVSGADLHPVSGTDTALQATAAQIPPTSETARQGAVAEASERQPELVEIAVAGDPVVQASIDATLAPGVRRLTPDGSDRLSFLFAEDCWVSIKGTQGTVLFGDLGKAGQTLEFVGAAPFTVLLGYAQGVILKYNSEPIALAPHTRNNVATLVLGQ